MEIVFPVRVFSRRGYREGEDCVLEGSEGVSVGEGVVFVGV